MFSITNDLLSKQRKSRKRKKRQNWQPLLEILEDRCLMAAEDPFEADAPAVDTAAPDPTTYQRGDYSVSEKTGAAVYSFPIVVPPGRGEMAPALALSYSSRAPLRGGVAAGWSLSFPSIQVDTSSGVSGERHYMATLGGAAGRLIQTPDVGTHGGVTYRLEHDDSFAIFERVPFAADIPPQIDDPVVIQGLSGDVIANSGPIFADPLPGGDEVYDPPGTPSDNVSPEPRATWLARTPDGVTHNFGYATIAGDTMWKLSRQTDRFGNQIDYNWARTRYAGGGVDFALESIEYTSNAKADLPAHARVDFEYASLEVLPGTQTPIGASVSYRTGQLNYEGARRLTAIVTKVRDEPGANWRTVRRVTLQYDLAALGYHDGQLTGTRLRSSPMRYLTAIKTTAYNHKGIATATPPVTFSYGDDSRRYENTKHVENSIPLITGFKTNYSTYEYRLMDMDGDGILDRVTTDIYGDGQLLWKKGLFGGGFEEGLPRWMDLPTIPWRNNGSYPDRSRGERLSLAGQISAVTNVDDFPENYKPDVNHLVYHFGDMDGDGDTDLVTALYYDHNAYDPHALPDGTQFPLPGEPQLPLPGGTSPTPPDGTTLPLPGGTGGVIFAGLTEVTPTLLPGPYNPNRPPLPQPPTPPEGPPGRNAPEKRDGQFVWRLYRNEGFEFVAENQLILSPVEMKARAHTEVDQVENGDGGVTNYINRFGTFTIIDTDGDGNLNVVPMEDHLVKRSNTPSKDEHYHSAMTTMQDVNGDGLPDLVAANDDSVTARLNNGQGGFASNTLVMTDRYDSISKEYVSKDYLGYPESKRIRGTAYYHVDVDADGLPDLLDLSGEHVAVYFNVGGEFAPNPAFLQSEFRDHADRRYEEYFDRKSIEKWAQVSDFIDADGDGLRDLVRWELLDGPESGWTQTILSQNIAGAPPRRLLQVNNGVGGTIEYHYSPVTDPGVVSRGYSDDLPHKFWVVDTIAIGDSADSPESTTTYVYANPVYNAQSDRADAGSILGIPTDASASRRFLGFGIVTKDLPAGGRVVSEYDYDVPNDARGYVSRETTYNRDEDDELVPTSRVTANWINQPLFDGQVTFTSRFSTITTTFNADGAAPLDNIHQQYDIYLASQNDDDQIIAYELRGTKEYTGLYQDDTTRRTLISYVRSDTPELYHVAPSHVSEWEAKPGTDGKEFRLLSDEYTRYDSLHLPFRVVTVIDDESTAVTLNEYDKATGNLIATAKPQQVADESGERSTFEYDSFGIYVTRTVNELGHEVLDSYDVGAGSLLLRRGPNSKHVGNDIAWETEKWQRDGLDRVTNHFISIDHPKLGYELRSVEQFIYTDSAYGRSVTQKQLLDFADSQWITTTQDYDGRGRLIRDTERSEQGPVLTEYQYDEGGNLQTIDAPKPGSNDPDERVMFEYERDALGRVVSFTRPDGTGISIAYDGLTETTTEVTADGSGGAKVSHHDPYGHLIRLEEIGGAHGPAISQYEYDGLDRVSSIIDADGNVTQIQYDLVGQRRSITRGERSWHYDYDHNGNLIAETTPVPEGEEPSGYTTRIAYDALDRIISRTPAPRGMSDQRMEELGIGTMLYEYDVAEVEDLGRIQQMHGFHAANNYSENWGGLGEKWFYDRNNKWHFLTPDGAIHRWVSGIALDKSQQIIAADPSVHADPSRLFDAAVKDLGLVQMRHGFHSENSAAENWGGLAEKWFYDSSNKWHFITPDGAIYRWNGKSDLTTSKKVTSVDQSVHVDLRRLFDSVVQDLGQLQQEYGFHAAKDYAENWGGLREKWFYDNSNHWHFITPDGAIYSWNRRGLSHSTRIAIVNRSVHADPERLLDATTKSSLSAIEGAVGIESATLIVNNAIGRLSRVELPFGEIRYAYNAQGLVEREERSFNIDYLNTAAATQWIEREYNPLGQATVVRHDDGTTWRTNNDERGLVQNVQWLDAVSEVFRSVANYTRSLSGHTIRRDSDFGQTRDFDYDDFGRPIRDEIFVGDNLIADRTYDYSDSGDLLHVSGQTNGVSAEARFTYDGLHRLISAQGPNGYEGTFTFSAAGNVLTADVDWNDSPHSRNVSYVYGATDPQAVDALIDRETGETWASYEYDLAGAMTRRETGEGVWTFAYDGENQMREADGPNGREAYYYDHNGQRMLAVTEKGIRFTFGPSETRYDANGKESVRYFHIAGTGSTLARVETRSDKDAEIELQYSDSLRNLMVSLDADGQQTGAFLYGPFGEVVYSEGADDHNRHFNGKEEDAATGLRYYGARYYDPTTLRWASADPKYGFLPDAAIGDPRRANLYTFSGDNPVRYVDPDGRDFLENLGGFFVGVGEGAWHAVTHPVQTVENVAEGAASFAVATGVVDVTEQVQFNEMDRIVTTTVDTFAHAKGAADITRRVGFGVGEGVAIGGATKLFGTAVRATGGTSAVTGGGGGAAAAAVTGAAAKAAGGTGLLSRMASWIRGARVGRALEKVVKARDQVNTKQGRMRRIDQMEQRVKKGPEEMMPKPKDIGKSPGADVTIDHTL